MPAAALAAVLFATPPVTLTTPAPPGQVAGRQPGRPRTALGGSPSPLVVYAACLASWGLGRRLSRLRKPAVLGEPRPAPIPEPGVPPVAHVLVIDDDEQLLGVLRATLEATGHAVETARSAGEGLAALGRGRFDLVVCDVFLPRPADGVAAIREIRRAAPAVPVVAMSGQGIDRCRELFQTAGRLGACAFLPKPVDRDDLLALAGATA